MTSVTLTKLFMNLHSTGDALSAQSNSRSAAYVNLGERKHLSGGRLRFVSVVGEEGTFNFTMLAVPETDVEVLRAWKGQTVQVRDDRGRIFVGVYKDVSTVDLNDKKTSYDVVLTLETVTADEGV